jgi:hypothetical protein
MFGMLVELGLRRNVRMTRRILVSIFRALLREIKLLWFDGLLFCFTKTSYKSWKLLLSSNDDKKNKDVSSRDSDQRHESLTRTMGTSSLTKHRMLSYNLLQIVSDMSPATNIKTSTMHSRSQQPANEEPLQVQTLAPIPARLLPHARKKRSIPHEPYTQPKPHLQQQLKQ